MSVNGSKTVLVISDSHFPYAHPDIIAFLKAIKTKFKPDRVIHIGDEIDGHSISMHSHSPDLMSPSDEFEKAIERLGAVYRLFPKVDVLESNHGSLVYRRGTVSGLPRSVFKKYRQILDAPEQWNWHFDLTIPLSDGTHCYFHHGKSTNGIKLSQAMGMSVVQGHYHEKFAIEYWANPLGLYWSMQVGCLIDDKSLAFEYNNVNLKRPVIGCGVIVNGHPKLVPMVLTKAGRWNKKLI